MSVEQCFWSAAGLAGILAIVAAHTHRKKTGERELSPAGRDPAPQTPYMLLGIFLLSVSTAALSGIWRPDAGGALAVAVGTGVASRSREIGTWHCQAVRYGTVKTFTRCWLAVGICTVLFGLTALVLL